MSFTSEDERIYNQLIVTEIISLHNEEIDCDEFELNINSNAFATQSTFESQDEDFVEDLEEDPSLLNATFTINDPDDFSIRDEVEKYERALKKQMNMKNQSFVKLFKPIACSTPIPSAEDANQKLQMVESIECAEQQHIAVPLESSNAAMSVDLLRTAEWNMYQAPPSIAPDEITKHTVATPFLCPNVCIDEYSASSSVIQQNIFFSQLQTQEKIAQGTDIMRKIEGIVEKLIEDLCSEKPLSFRIKDTRTDNIEVIDDIVKMKPDDRAKFKTINFNSKASSGQFSRIVVLLEEAYKLLKTNTVCNKREIYYRHPQVMKDMRCLEYGIKDMCSLLQTSTWELGIVATAKGLASGPLRIVMNTNDVIDCGAVTEGTSLPHNFNAVTRLETNAKFVLVVEKDTVFQRFLKDDIFSRLGVPFILVTGKGVPDTCTRFFLKRIWDDLKLPIYVLVDADPYGIEIMLTYRHGSMAMCQQADFLAIPSIKWIGIHATDLNVFTIPTQPLTPYDHQRIKYMLKRSYLLPKIAKQLEILQLNGVKAEIEGLYTISDNFIIDDYLTQKLKDNLSI